MYIETDKHKILFDMGPDAQFIDNAAALGVDLTKVDIAFLSHADTFFWKASPVSARPLSSKPSPKSSHSIPSACSSRPT